MRTAACQPRNAPIIPISVTSPNPIASRRKTKPALLRTNWVRPAPDQQARQADPEPLEVGDRRP